MTAITYEVRVSSRAKYPRLRMSACEGLVVVIPDGFDEARIPLVIEEKRDWIQRNEERRREQLKLLVTQPPFERPESISLRAVGQEWSIVYRLTDRSSVTCVERKGHRLLIYGSVDNDAAVTRALQRWLSRKTREHAVQWLTVLARERGLEFSEVNIRSQRTRWASCSGKGTISFNLRLMFLPSDLVKYVLLHELAHTKEMNHSRRYWMLLESFEPNYRELDERLRAAWQLVPSWMFPSRTLGTSSQANLLTTSY